MVMEADGGAEKQTLMDRCMCAYREVEFEGDIRS